ncbi:MAG: RNA polymerase sigma factor [Saprospiraceae bacterium]|nr:RNA polymerase sigma factor [Saprospiraceae bacterium]
MIKARDEKGLATLYDKYSAALLGIIIRIIGKREVAEEILQQTFLKIWDGIDKYDASKSTLFTWMSTIARNSAIDKRRLVSYQNQNKTDDLDTHVSLVGNTSTKTHHIDVTQLNKLLDEKYKIVLDYVYLQGYSQSEAAEALEIPLGTVKTRIRQAIKILRDELKNEKNLFIGLLILIIILLSI